MTRTSFWILLILFVQTLLCSWFVIYGVLVFPTLHSSLLADIARIFEFNGVAYLSLSVAGFACFSQDTRLGQIVGWIALGVIGLSVLNALAGVMWDHSNRRGVGFVLYPPLSTQSAKSFFSPADPSTSGLLVGMTLKAILESLSIALSMMGCAVILGKRHMAQTLVAGTCVMIGAFALWTVITLWNGQFLNLQWPVYVMLGLLLVIGLTTSDLLNRSDAHYALAAVVYIIIVTAANGWLYHATRPPSGAGSAYEDTYYVVSTNAYWVSVVPFFLLFAALFAWLRPKIGARATGWHASLILVVFALNSVPMAVFFGMPRRFIDYERTMGIFIAIQSIAGFISLVLIIGGLILMTTRRAR